MAYDPSKDPTNGRRDFLGLGRKQRVVTPSDTVDLDPYARTIVALTAGDVVYLPAGNEDADTITAEGVTTGWTPMVAVRRVLATDTTATVATVDD